MEIVTLIIAVVALLVAVLAYVRTGGVQELRNQVSALGTSTEGLRAKTTDTLDVLRSKTADTLDRLERMVRGSGETQPPAPPEQKKKEGNQREDPVRRGPADPSGPGGAR